MNIISKIDTSISSLSRCNCLFNKLHFVWIFFFLTFACHTGCTRKQYKEGECALLLSTKYEPDMVKTYRDIEVRKLWFLIVCEKCHVGDVTVGGASIVSTSGFRFPVGHDLNRLSCSGEFLVVAYFRRARCSKVGNHFCDFSFLQGSVGLSWGRCVFLLLKSTRGGERGGELLNFSLKSQLL